MKHPRQTARRRLRSQIGSTDFAPGDPGSVPGIESIAGVNEPPAAGTIHIQCTDYGPEHVASRTVTDLAELFRQPRTPTCPIRWLNVDGLHPHIVNQLRHELRFHTLSAEDVLRVPQRPKLEIYDGYLFIVARMLRLQNQAMVSEQVSFFLFENTLLTFQETDGDVWAPIRARLQQTGSRLRLLDTSYLLYALLDVVVDHCFPLLEHYDERLEELENGIIGEPTRPQQQQLYALKRELALLRRVIWPLRDVLNALCHEDTKGISPSVKMYLRDVTDHTVQVMDIVESCREMAASLNDLYLSAVSNRMNEVMKVLTLIATFFIPITFVSGVFGMNFDGMPALHWKYGYAMFWVLCASVTLGLAIFFVRKGWIGRK